MSRQDAALETALRDAMPGWLTVWTERSTTRLRTAIAQAEAAAPPEGSTLFEALLTAKEVLRKVQVYSAFKVEGTTLPVKLVPTAPRSCLHQRRSCKTAR